MPEGEPDPQPGQRERLGERAQHEHVREPADQPERVLAREVDVRLVDDQEAGQRARQRLDPLERHERSRGRVRVAEEGDARARGAERGRQREVVGERDAHGRAPLHGDQRLVEAVGRHRERDAVARVDGRAQDEGQQLVRAVAGHDVVGRHAVHLRRPRAERARLRVGIEPDARVGLARDRLEHVRRGRVRVLVGVELDHPAAGAGLLTGDVGRDAPDGRAEPVRGAGQATSPP